MACSLGMSLSLNWQDHNNNYSSVHARVWITTSNGSYNDYSPSGSGSVDGQGFSFSHGFGKNTTTTLWEGDFNIGHPADGRKGTIGASVSFNTGISAGTISASVSLGLPDIPRASQPSVSNGSPTLGNSITVYTNRASTSFTHNLSWWSGSLSGTIANGVSDSVSWTIPTSIATQYPNENQGAIGIHCDTYSGGTYIGRKDVYITAKIPTSYVPSFTSLAIARVDNGVPSSWAIYVKGYSKVTATINGATGSNGSTIKSYSIIVENVGSSSKSTDTIGPINVSGAVKIKATITDSRGRTATKETTITVIDYTPPSLTLDAKRCLSNGTVDGEGTYVKITPTYTFASVSGKNSITVKNFSVNGETNTTCVSGSSVILGKGALSVAKEYTVTAYIKDALVQTQTINVTLPIGQIFLHFPETFYGLGINRYCTVINQVQIGSLDLNLINAKLLINSIEQPVFELIENADVEI